MNVGRKVIRILVLVPCCFVAIGARAGADPYYTVTDLGSANDVTWMSDASGQEVVENTRTGVSYPVPNSPRKSLSSYDPKDLPGIYGTQGTIYPQRTFFPMQVIDWNSQGTFIGGVPSGSSQAVPYSSLILGYAQMTPDGHFGPFQPLSQKYGAMIQLNARNQILITNDYDFIGNRLFDANTHQFVDFSQLIAPGVLQHVGRIVPFSLIGDGAFLATIPGPSGSFDTALVTPPDLPAPVPEPTTLILFAMVVGVVVVQHRRGGRLPLRSHWTTM
jgi:hypothetical protein